MTPTLAYRRHRLERLVAHRELQLARAYAAGDGRYIEQRRRKLERAQRMLQALDARTEKEQVA